VWIILNTLFTTYGHNLVIATIYLATEKNIQKLHSFIKRDLKSSLYSNLFYASDEYLTIMVIYGQHTFDNFKHIVLFMEMDHGLMCYECLAIRWFSMYVGDINICLFALLTNVVFVKC